MSQSGAEPQLERSPAIEGCVDEEVLEWYRMSPRERWAESMRLWDTFYLLGGQLEPEPDSQSPFHDARARRGGPADGRPGLRSLRRSGV
jgi:hypothetical protein